MRAAIALAPAGRVLILTKADANESNTGYAQGGIAAAIGPDDSPALHAADTIRAGDGLCDEAAVRALVEDGPHYVRELVAWGAAFDRDRGDGVALAHRAGARVADLEFVQFHPTALSLAGAPRFLISEALRGEGARLVNERGEAFMTRYHADGDLAPRDVVARSIAREAQRTGGPVFLTLAHLDPDFVRRRFPMIADMCRRLD